MRFIGNVEAFGLSVFGGPDGLRVRPRCLPLWLQGKRERNQNLKKACDFVFVIGKKCFEKLYGLRFSEECGKDTQPKNHMDSAA